ncbi:hypothetical protein HPB52_021071 [Rhipicephalus sanguineus]|uniref:Uncharacterized protein n=1 Tax=Rhipicephalus sanguineus TaxID=34632 RepID=A0A9D4SZ73_RHISA|nr:hypothetical protein HPB52_021071 [Rhipicephalus sanguineus]
MYEPHVPTLLVKLFENETVGKEGLRYIVAWSVYRQLVEFTDPYMFLRGRTTSDACYEHIIKVMNLAVISPFFQSGADDVEQKAPPLKIFEDRVHGTQYLVEWMRSRNLDLTNDTRLATVKPVEMMVRASLDLGLHVVIAILFKDKEFVNREETGSEIPQYMIGKGKEMVSTIRSTYQKAFESSTWLGREYREALISKLKNITTYVGSPGKRLDPEYIEDFYSEY